MNIQLVLAADVVLDSDHWLCNHIKISNPTQLTNLSSSHRELLQLLDSGERGDLAADDDCRRSLLRLLGLPSRS